MESDSLLPPCRIYNPDSYSWQSFKFASIILPNQKVVFSYKNDNSVSSTIITKTISYDYVAYFSKVIPSALLKREWSPEISRFPLHRQANDLASDDVKVILVFEDLTLRYAPFLHEDQFILLGFNIDNPVYEETNQQFIKVKDLIAQAHFNLKYSEGGLIYQVSQRVQTMLYKTVKYGLCSLAEFFNIHSSLKVLDKLATFQRMCQDPAFMEYVGSVIQTPAFYKDLTSLAYKTIIQTGLFPCYVELNTMDEIGIWVKIKDLITSQTSAPYGANHHASFCIGNFRYSFIFEPSNKEKQRVTINMEVKRGFCFKNRGFEYFRIRSLDFFPMDEWVEEIASAARKIIAIYLEKTSGLAVDPCEKKDFLREYLEHITDGGCEESRGVGIRIAEEFYQKYREQLNGTMNNKMFEKMVQEIVDAELRGYKSLSNNCQTIVFRLLEVLQQHLDQFKQPFSKISEAQNMSKGQGEEKMKDTFLKFASHFNSKFRYVAPFYMTYKLPHFNIYVDRDTSELLNPQKLGSVHSHIKSYLERKNIQKFLKVLEKGLTVYVNKYRQGGVKSNVSSREGEQLEQNNDISVGGDDYGIISCLTILMYNELFRLKREIKMGKECKANLDQKRNLERKNDAVSKAGPKKIPSGQKEVRKEWEDMVAKMPELYSQKYHMLNICRELDYYYYNNVRLGNRLRGDEKAAYFGFLMIRNPSEISLTKNDAIQLSRPHVRISRISVQLKENMNYDDDEEDD